MHATGTAVCPSISPLLPWVGLRACINAGFLRIAFFPRFPRCSRDASGTALGELFDPTGATFTATATGGTQALRLAAASLKDGRVVLAGGEVTTIISGGSTRCCLSGPASVASATLFDNGSETFSAAGDMSASRAFQTATLLGDGKVLIAGGANVNSVVQG